MAAHDNIVFVDSSGAARSITLPTPTNGRILTVKDSTGSAATNNITILPSAAELIDGLSSLVITAAWGEVQLQSNGTNWFTDKPASPIVTSSSGSTTDNALARWDGTTGTIIQNSNATLSDAGALTVTTTASATAFIPTGSTVPVNGMYLSAANTVALSSNTAVRFTVNSSGLSLFTIGAGTSFRVNASDATLLLKVDDDYSLTLGRTSATETQTLNGNLKIIGAIFFTPVRTVTTTATVAAGDTVVLCNQSAAFALTLPTATDGRMLIIKDFSNTAATNNITVTRASSDVIDGATTYVMNVNRQSITLIGTSGNWSIV